MSHRSLAHRAARGWCQRRAAAPRAARRARVARRARRLTSAVCSHHTPISNHPNCSAICKGSLHKWHAPGSAMRRLHSPQPVCNRSGRKKRLAGVRRSSPAYTSQHVAGQSVNARRCSLWVASTAANSVRRVFRRLPRRMFMSEKVAVQAEMTNSRALRLDGGLFGPRGARFGIQNDAQLLVVGPCVARA